MGVGASNILTSYKKSFSFLLEHRKLLLFLYLANLLFAVIAIVPLSWLVKSAFGSTLLLNDFVSSFNYTYIMEFMREYGMSINNLLNHSILIIAVFILWTIFINGGIARSLFDSREEWSLSKMWSYCGRYFGRFLVMHFYIFLCSGILAGVLIYIFLKDGLNPFDFETEQILISRFWILLVIFCVLGFFISILKDVAKICIVSEIDEKLHTLLFKAIKRFFSLDIILLAIMHFVFLLVITFVFFAFRKNMNHLSIAFIIIGQAYLILRISYRILRLSAFQNQLSLDPSITEKTIEEFNTKERV